MSETEGQSSENIIPRGVLIGAALLVGVALAGASLSAITGMDAAPPPESPAVASIELRFADRPDGSIAVNSGQGAEPIAVIGAGTNNFIRGAMRGLARERRRNEVAPSEPFVLTELADGSLWLTDTGTGARVYLDAYGPTNRDAFAELLQAGKDRKNGTIASRAAPDGAVHR